MTQFHGPFYTAWTQDSYFDQIVISKGLEHWIPLFDKHNMTIVFKNHTHAFKRSKMEFQMKVVQYVFGVVLN